MPDGQRIDLGSVKRPDGKVIHVWAVQGEIDTAQFKSNLFELEWPPKSGRMQQFPEIDRIAWVPLTEASAKLHTVQAVFMERLAERLAVRLAAAEPAGQASLF